MMMFGVFWLIILLVIVLPIVLIVLLLGRNDLFRQDQLAGVSFAKAQKSESKINSLATNMENNCSHCGAGLQNGWFYCPQCGAPI